MRWLWSLPPHHRCNRICASRWRPVNAATGVGFAISRISAANSQLHATPAREIGCVSRVGTSTSPSGLRWDVCLSLTSSLSNRPSKRKTGSGRSTAWQRRTNRSRRPAHPGRRHHPPATSSSAAATQILTEHRRSFRGLSIEASIGVVDRGAGYRSTPGRQCELDYASSVV